MHKIGLKTGIAPQTNATNGTTAKSPCEIGFRFESWPTGTVRVVPVQVQLHEYNKTEALRYMSRATRV